MHLALTEYQGESFCFEFHVLEHAVLFFLVVCTSDLFSCKLASKQSPEEYCVQAVVEARRQTPSILYMPRIDVWWSNVGTSLTAMLISLLDAVPLDTELLLLASAETTSVASLPAGLRGLFEPPGVIYTVPESDDSERRELFAGYVLASFVPNFM